MFPQHILRKNIRNTINSALQTEAFGPSHLSSPLLRDRKTFSGVHTYLPVGGNLFLYAPISYILFLNQICLRTLEFTIVLLLFNQSTYCQHHRGSGPGERTLSYPSGQAFWRIQQGIISPQGFLCLSFYTYFC